MHRIFRSAWLELNRSELCPQLTFCMSQRRMVQGDSSNCCGVVSDKWTSAEWSASSGRSPPAELATCRSAMD